MPSQDFQDFYYSCFDPSFGAVHDGLNIPALLKLQGPELAEAEQLILQAIEASLDPRPIRAAGYLKLPSASSPLKRRLESPIDISRADNRVHTAWALYQVEQHPEAAGTIVGVLQAIPRHNQWSRMMAVEALADLGQAPLAVSALLATLQDEDGFISFLAINSLKKVFKSQRQIVDMLNRLRHLHMELHSATQSPATEEARARLLKLVRAYQARSQKCFH